MTDPVPQWLTPPASLTLPPTEIHIWRTHLQVPDDQIAALVKALSPQERVRADRFHRQRDQQDFIVARGRLRTILSQYLDIAPDQLQFDYGQYGKPFLSHPSNALQFNLSHAHGLALYAIGRDRPLGIDLEYIHRPMNDLDGLVRRFFSPAEYTQWQSLPSEQQSIAFFRGWTCKEAYLKAIGTGLAQLEQVEVCLLPDRPAQLTRIAADAPASQWPLSDWTLQAWEPAPHYSAALAVAGQNWQFRYWCC